MAAMRFRGGLVFKAHRLLYHPTLGLRVKKRKSVGSINGLALPPLEQVAALHHTDLVASGSCDGSVRLWECSKDNSKLHEVAPHPQPQTLNTQHSTLNTQHSTLNTQHSTLNTEHGRLNPEL